MRTILWKAISAAESTILRPRCGGAIWAGRWVSLLLLLLLLAHQAGSFYQRETERTLRAAEIEPFASGEPGFAFVANIPGSRGDASLDAEASRLRLFEGELELGPPHTTHLTIHGVGEGAFSHWGTSLYFSSSDGSDPRTNGKTYVVRYVLRLSLWVSICVGLATFLLWAERLRAWLLRLEQTDPIWIILGLFVLTIAIRACWGYDTGLVDGSRIKQLPYSDAQRWMELSEDFARGARINPSWPMWEARRPMTYVINGSWMALVGTSTLAIVVLNVLCSGLSAGLIFDILRRLAPFPIALLGGLFHAFLLMDAAYGTTTLSEPGGYFFSNVALWTLTLAIVGERRSEAPRALYFYTGALIAISNLARPLTLLSAPAIPLLVLLILSRRGIGKRKALAGAIRAGLCVALGAALFIAPWLVRQRVQHGLLTLSDNTAEMLYAATDPRYPYWDAEVSLEATKAGHHTWAARNSYYNERVKENLRAYPGYYAETIAHNMRLASDQISGPRWWQLGLVLLGLWASGRKAARGEFLLYTGAALAVGVSMAEAFPPPGVWPWFLLACVLALARAEAISLLAVSLGATLFSIGMVASPFLRFTYSLHWLALALQVWAVWQLGRWARSGGESPDMEALQALGALPETPNEIGASRLLGKALGLLFATLAIGLVIALSRHLSPQVPPPLPQLEDPAAWRESALAQPEASSYAAISSGLVVRRLMILPSYLATFAAGEEYEHFSGLFATQDYARSYFRTSPPIHAPAGSNMLFSHASFPGELDLESELPVTAIGCWVASGKPVWGEQRFALFEIVAYTLAERPGGAIWVWASAEDRPRHGAELSARAAQGDFASNPE